MNEQLTREKLEEMSFDLIIEAGQYLHSREILNARIYYAVAWGINRDLENVDLMQVCNRGLRCTGLSKKETQRIQDWGYAWATITSTIRKMFDSDIGEEIFED